MTVIRPNSIAGITSIAAQDQAITFHTSDGTAIGQLNTNINATNGASTVTNLRVTGITTLGSSNGIGTVTIGIGTTALFVEGNARVTGILTVGSSSIVLDGTVDQVKVGTGVTIHNTNGVQVGNNTLHSTGLTVNNLNSTGIITATSFNGNGSRLTSVIASSLNSTGVSTVHTLYFSGRSNPLIVNPGGGTYNIYVSDSGNDSTGNGSSGSPYRSVNKAFTMVPDIVNRQSVDIIVLGASYTMPSTVNVNGIGGGGNYSAGQQIRIRADSAAITFNLNDYYFEFYDIEVPITFTNLNFVGGSNVNGIFATRCRFLNMQSNCTWTSNSTYGWSYGGGGLFYRTEVEWRAPVSLTSSASAGLGAPFVFDECRVFWVANLIKSGTRYGNTGISICNGSWFHGNGCTISNFNTGIYNGANHYNAETGGHTMLNGVTLSNCVTGIILANGAVNRAYSVTYSSNSTNISSSNSFST